MTCPYCKSNIYKNEIKYFYRVFKSRYYHDKKVVQMVI
jgi:hypothetical protein